MASDHELKVIGCGFGRTGTMTLKYTLEELGFGPCYHGSEIFANQFHLDLWMNIGDCIDKSKINWNEMIFANPRSTKTYNSSTDWPSAHYYKELHQYYPNAKFILTVRDPHKWYQSMLDTFVPPKLGMGHELRIIFWICLQIDPFLSKFPKMADRTYASDFGGLWNFRDNKELVIKHFVKHIENVKQTIDKDRLFILDWRRKDKKEMYKELCVFLDVEYNGQTFPMLNTSQFMRNMMKQKQWEALLSNKYFYAVILVFLFVLYSLIFR